MKPGYIKSLDGIRGLAVLLVICHHWSFNSLNLPFGWVGVQLFFVLSGFLITRILLNEKQFEFSKYLKRFYLKRALRIFPLYYGFLIFLSLVFILSATVLVNKSFSVNIIALLHELPVNGVFIFTYTYNFMEIFHRCISHSPLPDSYMFSHLWSLSVEEQFYIVFPFIVYFFSIKNFKRFLIFVLIACPVLRFVCIDILQSFTADNYFIGTIIYRQTPFQFDALCLGACLAVFDLKAILSRPKTAFYLFLIFTVAVGLINYILLHSTVQHVSLKGLGYEYAENMVYGNRLSYGLTFINICCCLLIWCSIKGDHVSQLFETRPMLYIGKISYGIYLLHYPLLRIYNIMLSHIFTDEQINNNFLIEVTVFIVYVSFVILVSTASYYMFELKFLKLKEKISNVESNEVSPVLPRIT
ncbi:MAG: acyltransferase [Bacteroidia bacterium]